MKLVLVGIRNHVLNFHKRVRGRRFSSPLAHLSMSRGWRVFSSLSPSFLDPSFSPQRSFELGKHISQHPFTPGCARANYSAHSRRIRHPLNSLYSFRLTRASAPDGIAARERLTEKSLAQSNYCLANEATYSNPSAEILEFPYANPNANQTVRKLHSALVRCTYLLFGVCHAISHNFISNLICELMSWKSAVTNYWTNEFPRRQLFNIITRTRLQRSRSKLLTAHWVKLHTEWFH